MNFYKTKEAKSVEQYLQEKFFYSTAQHFQFRFGVNIDLVKKNFINYRKKRKKNI
jgi:hypothetical protein